MPPNNEGWILSSALPTKAHEIADNLLNSVVAETLRAFLTVQLKGMLLISSAWSGGINAGEVAEQADRNKKVMDVLAAFPAEIAETIDQAVADCLKTYGQHIGEPLKSNDREWHYDRRAIGNRNQREENDMPYKVFTGVNSRWIVQNRGYPLNDDYIIWDQVKEVYPVPNATPSYVGDDIVLLERPWELDNCRTVGIWGELQHGIDSDPVVVMVFRFPTNVARFPREAHDGLAFLGALS